MPQSRIPPEEDPANFGPVRGCLFAAPLGLAFWALLFWLAPSVALYTAGAIVAACILIAAHGAIQRRRGRDSTEPETRND